MVFWFVLNFPKHVFPVDRMMDGHITDESFKIQMIAYTSGASSDLVNALSSGSRCLTNLTVTVKNSVNSVGSSGMHV